MSVTTNKTIILKPLQQNQNQCASGGILKIDFLRRCKMFGEVKDYKNKYFDDFYFDNILKYQLYLAEQKDDKIHYLDEV